MPANLTQQYRKAERAFRQATTQEEELLCLQEMLRELPKHKGTDKLQAELRQRISQTKKECEAAKSAKKRVGGFRIPRQGAGRVVLLGGPNTGKSQFVRATTRADPKIADYPFTTQEPAPAMMPYEDIFIQLVDTQPVTSDILDTTTIGLVRGADLCLLMGDLATDAGWDDCRNVFHRFEQTKTRLGRETYLDRDDIGRSYTQCFLVWNKIDLQDAELRWELFEEAGVPKLETYKISARTSAGIGELQRAIFDALDVVRVYTKTPLQKEPDYSNPYTIHRGGTLSEFAALVHKDIAERLKFARVWGSAVHDGTAVKSDYVIQDRDVVELHH